MSEDDDKKDDTGNGTRMLRMMSNIETQYTMPGDVGVDDAVDPTDDEGCYEETACCWLDVLLVRLLVPLLLLHPLLYHLLNDDADFLRLLNKSQQCQEQPDEEGETENTKESQTQVIQELNQQLFPPRCWRVKWGTDAREGCERDVRERDARDRNESQER